MATYTEIATELTDKWIKAVGDFQENLPHVDRALDALPSALRLSDAVTAFPAVKGLPTAAEIATANHEAAKRVLDAHHEFTMTVIERLTPSAAAGTEADDTVEAEVVEA